MLYLFYICKFILNLLYFSYICFIYITFVIFFVHLLYLSNICYIYLTCVIFTLNLLYVFILHLFYYLYMYFYCINSFHPCVYTHSHITLTICNNRVTMNSFGRETAHFISTASMSTFNFVYVYFRQFVFYPYKYISSEALENGNMLCAYAVE